MQAKPSVLSRAGELIDLSAGFSVALLPFVLTAIPGLVLFVLLPLAAIALLAAIPVLLIGVLAGPPYLAVRHIRRSRT